MQMAAGTGTAYMGRLPKMEFKLADAGFVNVSLSVNDRKTQNEIKDYTISVKDEKGNVTTVTDGAFKGLVGRTYSYAIKAAGYMYKEGSFEIPEDTTGGLVQKLYLTPSSNLHGMERQRQNQSRLMVYIRSEAELSSTGLQMK